MARKVRRVNPLVSEPSPRNAEKMPYRGLAAVPPFALRGLRLRATVALAPGLPKQADRSRNGSGCPLGMACRSPSYAFPAGLLGYLHTIYRAQIAT